MRWSERLLQGDAQAGNFRGVCPLNRAKGNFRSLNGVNVRRSLVWGFAERKPRNLFWTVLSWTGWNKLRIFREDKETHGAVL